MSEDTRQDNDAAAEPEETGPVGGERLRIAREEQQISILEIAKELHLDETNVRYIEDNDFESLGAPVFAKGHLRKYAALVGVDERDVLADYHELTRSATMPPVVSKRRRPGSELSPGPWVAVILLLIVAALAYWWLTQPGIITPPVAEPGVVEPEPAATESPAATAPPMTDEPGAETAPADEAPDEPAAAAVQPEPAARTPVTETPVAEPGETVADTAGRTTLALAFAEDCWTEVTDATGERLFFGLGENGSSVTVTGVAPLSVLLGSADDVTVTVDGENYTISAADRRGRTARFTLP
ncbi:MAG: RodZ domain-containing protein [Woeseiaceae bacterium]|jgi:cytoskeleton protein RodZ|nr:RodZ domain-containing protein [Woeseiaceae bacterium]